MPQLKNLDDWLAYINRCHPAEMELGLARTQQVGNQFDAFNFNCPVVIVAGTNGKGSCIKALMAAYQEAGYRTGATFSPHIFRFNERLYLNNTQVTDEALCDAFAFVESHRGELSLTYFEYTTLASLYLLKQAALDVVLLEVGLGGRLDAVNCVDADVAVVTTIGLDHQQWLGETVEAIAAEKAGIFKANQKGVVLGPKADLPCLERSAQEKELPVYKAQLPEIATTLPAESVGCALSVLEILQQDLPLALPTALQSMAKAPHLGRFTRVPGDVEQVFDVAHNTQGAAWLALTCQQFPPKGRTLAVWASYNDKDLCGLVSPFKELIDCWYTGQGEHARLASAKVLQGVLLSQEMTVEVRDTLVAAYQAAMAAAQPGDRVLIFGGFAILEAVLPQCTTDLNT